jgi:cold shock CspA family protein
MPEGTIQSYDAEEQHGFIAPDEGGDPLPFQRDDVTDYHVGERLSVGQDVVYEEDEDDGAAVEVRRVSPPGYG